MPIQIKELISSDSLSQAIEKLNFNFDQLILGGGGPLGPAGPTGIQGPDGALGTRGSKFKVNSASGAPGSVTVTGGFNPDDKILDIGGTVWNYSGTAWIDSGVNLIGPSGDKGDDGDSPEIKRYRGSQQGNKWLVESPITSGFTDITTTPDFFGFHDNNTTGINVHVFGHLQDFMIANTGGKSLAVDQMPTMVVMQSSVDAGLFIGMGATSTTAGVRTDPIDLDTYSNIYKGVGGLIIDAARGDNVSNTEGNLTLSAKGAKGKVSLESDKQKASIDVGSNTASEYNNITLKTLKNNSKIKLKTLDSTLIIDEFRGIVYDSNSGSVQKERLRILRNGNIRTGGSLLVNTGDTNFGMHWAYGLKIMGEGDSVGRDLGIQLGGAIVQNIIYKDPIGWQNEDVGAGWRLDLRKPDITGSTTTKSELTLRIAGDSRTNGTNTPTTAGTALQTNKLLLEPIKITTYDGRIELQDDSNINSGITIGKSNIPEDFLAGDEAAWAGGTIPLFKTLFIGSFNNEKKPRIAVGYDSNNYTAMAFVKEDNTPGIDTDAHGRISGRFDGTGSYNEPAIDQSFTWGKVSGTSGQVVFNLGSGVGTSRDYKSTDKLNIAGGIKLTDNSFGWQYSNIGKHYSDIMFAGSGNSRSTMYFGSETEDPIADLAMATGHSSGIAVPGVSAYSKINVRSDSDNSAGSGITIWDIQNYSTGSGKDKMFGKTYWDDGGLNGYVYKIETDSYRWNTSSSAHASLKSDILINSKRGDVDLLAEEDITIETNTGDIRIIADANATISGVNTELNSSTGNSKVYSFAGNVLLEVGSSTSEIQIRPQGSRAVDYVLTCTDADGSAEWKPNREPFYYSSRDFTNYPPRFGAIDDSSNYDIPQVYPTALPNDNTYYIVTIHFKVTFQSNPKSTIGYPTATINYRQGSSGFYTRVDRSQHKLILEYPFPSSYWDKYSNLGTIGDGQGFGVTLNCFYTEKLKATGGGFLLQYDAQGPRYIPENISYSIVGIPCKAP